MAIRRIIDIELNDEPLKKFQAGLAAADASTKSIQAGFGKVAEGVRITGEHAAKYRKILQETNGDHEKALELLEQQTASEEKLQEFLEDQAKAKAEIADKGKLVTAQVDRQAKFTAQIGRQWHGMARDVKSFAASIENATKSILKWSGVFGLTSGVLGFGGLFGLDRMAQGVSSDRRGALGLGVSIGEKKAFDLNYGRVINSESFLGGVNESITDLSKRGSLYNAGLTEHDVAGKDTAQVAELLIDSLKKKADQGPASAVGTTWEAYGLGQFLSRDDFIRLRNTPASELGEYKKQYEKDIKTLNVNDPTAKAWQDFVTQLTRAGQTIENVLVKSLVL
jgi:hypothetical protein